MQKIVGQKGGSQKQHTPKESPDSLHSLATARILLALGEGEFAGGVTDKDIYLDGTPIANPDGSYNFPGVKWEFRPGTQTQNYIQGVPAAENELTKNIDLKAGTPHVENIQKLELTAVKVRVAVTALQEQKDNGDVVGSEAKYTIAISTDGGAFQTKINGTFRGKATSLYERTHRINLPPARVGWQIRITRETPDATSVRIANATRLQAITEVIDARLRYPNTAMLFIAFDAKQFNNIPQVSVKARGRIIRVPNNYDPASRGYSGTWDGTFKWAYSNNPAWVFYDIILEERFGLGNRLKADQVDKWELYRIAQYCDQLVDNGKGGKEPRFMCDVYIQSQNEAFGVLRDLAAIFRGMTYWAQNQLYTLADMDSDRVFTYTRANVINGKFTYAGGSEKNRYSTALVSWSNPQNHYADEVEAVVEQDLVRRYGIKQTDISAIGCTRQSEAHRRGRWALLTNAKDRMVTFSTGLDGYIPLPGYIVGVQDSMLAGRVMGGRIHSTNGRSITLDRAPDAKVGDRLYVNLPRGTGTGYNAKNHSQARTIQSINGNVVIVQTPYSQQPEPDAVWSVDSASLAVQLYRVTSVVDNDDGTFTISGIFHNPSKYAFIDSGVRLVDPTISQLQVNTIAAPKNIKIVGSSRIVQNISVAKMRVTWDAVPGAVAYEAQWRKDNGDWVNVPRLAPHAFEIEGIYAGTYIVQVRAIDISDVSSQWAMSAPTDLKGKYGKPDKPVNFRASDDVLWGIDLDWEFPADAEDTLQTEIRYHTSLPDPNDHGDFLLLTDVPYPSHSYSQMGLKAGQEFWYKARIIDRIGNKSDWTDWIQGLASSNAADYLVDIDAQIKASTAWQQLTQTIGNLGLDPGAGIERDIATALAQHATFVEERADDARTTASIKNIRQVIADDKQALALQIDEFKARFDDNEALIQTETKARSDELSALATQMTKLQAEVGTDIAAKLATESSARADADKAQVEAMSKLEAKVTKDVTASIQALDKTVSTNKQAAADSIKQLSTTVSGADGKGGIAATVTSHSNTIANLNGKLTAQWGVQVVAQSNKTQTIAGIQLGIDGNKGGSAKSSFIVLADKFAVYNTKSNAAVVPFVISGNSTFIQSAFIQDGTITNAKIGGTISSVGYVAGSKGWSINKTTGAFELNGTVAGKGSIKMGNGIIEIKDTARVRVKLGVW